MWGSPLSESESFSVVFDSLWPHGLYSPWNSLGQNTGEGSLAFLQGIFPTQGSNPGLPHCRWVLYQLSYQGSSPLRFGRFTLKKHGENHLGSRSCKKNNHLPIIKPAPCRGLSPEEPKSSNPASASSPYLPTSSFLTKKVSRRNTRHTIFQQNPIRQIMKTSRC